MAEIKKLLDYELPLRIAVPLMMLTALITMLTVLGLYALITSPAP